MNSVASNLVQSFAAQGHAEVELSELEQFQGLLETGRDKKFSAGACYRRLQRHLNAAFKGRVLLHQVLDRGKKNESFKLIAWSQDSGRPLLFVECSVSRDNPFSGFIRPILKINPEALAAFLRTYSAASFKELVEERHGLVCALAWEVLFINRKITRPENEFSFLTRRAELYAKIGPPKGCITIDGVMPFDAMSPEAVRRRQSCLRYDWLLTAANRDKLFLSCGSDAGTGR